MLQRKDFFFFPMNKNKSLSAMIEVLIYANYEYAFSYPRPPSHFYTKKSMLRQTVILKQQKTSATLLVFPLQGLDPQCIMPIVNAKTNSRVRNQRVVRIQGLKG